ncbi:MAG: hypothetical protein WB626_04530, partial [Bacteroidota bacterium]
MKLVFLVQDVRRVFRRRKRHFLIPLVTCLAAGAALSFLLPARYESASVILDLPGRMNITGGDVVPGRGNPASVLGSPFALGALAESIRTHRPGDAAWTAREILSSLRVDTLGGGRFRIAVRHRDAEAARRAAGALAGLYLRHRREMVRQLRADLIRGLEVEAEAESIAARSRAQAAAPAPGRASAPPIEH